MTETVAGTTSGNPLGGRSRTAAGRHAPAGGNMVRCHFVVVSPQPSHPRTGARHDMHRGHGTQREKPGPGPLSLNTDVVVLC